ncbi:MAG: phosphomevalonate kinase [Candidatus Diapherotrites archaeon]
MEIDAPGKLMLSGEWSVLEPNNACIALAINKKVKVKIKENNTNKINITLKNFGIKTKAILKDQKLIFDSENPILNFTKKSLETTIKYLQETGTKIKFFDIETKTITKTKGMKKAGFGSSAATCVAIITAIMKYHKSEAKIEEEKEKIFKLATISHYLAQEKIGSGFDIATSTYGGTLIYKRFDAEWLLNELQQKKISQVIKQKWPLLQYEKIELPKDMLIIAGFTGKSASTKELVKKMLNYKRNNKTDYERAIKNLAEITEKLSVALKKSNKTAIIELIKQNRLALKNLGELSGTNLETEELRKIAEIAEKNGGAGKFSGAGGGDCGIAICFDKKTMEKIKEEFRKEGIQPISFEIDKEGVKVCND